MAHLIDSIRIDVAPSRVTGPPTVEIALAAFYKSLQEAGGSHMDAMLAALEAIGACKSGPTFVLQSNHTVEMVGDILKITP